MRIISWDNHFVYKFERLFAKEVSLMRIIRTAGLVWLMACFALLMWGQVRDIESNLEREQRHSRERTLVNEEKISELQRRASEASIQADARAALLQQVVSDMTFLRGMVIGFGGLMSFLQFLTVVGMFKGRRPDMITER